MTTENVAVALYLFIVTPLGAVLGMSVTYLAVAL